MSMFFIILTGCASQEQLINKGFATAFGTNKINKELVIDLQDTHLMSSQKGTEILTISKDIDSKLETAWKIKKVNADSTLNTLNKIIKTLEPISKELTKLSDK